MPIHLPSSIPIKIPFMPERGFNHIKPIRITNRTTKLTEYQGAINLNASNFAFEKARSDGADIRFQDANGEALSYWIKSWTSTSAKIWVKLDELENYEERFIYMIYGNYDAITESNGKNTFDQFVDFSNDVYHEIEASHTIEDGGDTIYLYGNSHGYVSLSITISGTGDQILEVDLKSTDIGEVTGMGLLLASDGEFWQESRAYKFCGSQDWALTPNQTYTAGGAWQNVYAILNDFSGAMVKTWFGCDDDDSSGKAWFRYPRIRKYSSTPPLIEVL